MRMKERFIDVGLIVTLVIVAFGITWTLLTLNRSQGRTAERATVTRELPVEPTNSGGDIVPIAPDGTVAITGSTSSSNGAGSGAARTPGSPTSSTATATAATPTTTTTPTTPSADAESEATATTEAPEPEPVPEGAVGIDRIGFSFATGGTGACGIVLEPWKHVAVSRELLASYGCGTEIEVRLDDEIAGRTSLRAVIGDTMNPSFSRTVNIYVASDEPAFTYGVTTGTIEP